MYRQRGFITLTPNVILTIVVIAASAALVFAVHLFTSSLVAKGHQAGKAECEAAYVARDNKQLEDTLAKLTALQKEKDALEATAKADSLTMQQQLKEKINENRTLADRNRLLTGSRGVRNDAFVGPTNCDRSPEGETPRPPTGSDGTATCDLSPGTKQSLRDIGLRADKTAIQLAACQKLLLSDRKFCNSPGQ